MIQVKYRWYINGNRCVFFQKLKCAEMFFFSMCAFIQSKASDMRFDGIFGEKKLQDSKRQRVINSRYRGDYIEPVIYRTIME